MRILLYIMSACAIACAIASCGGHKTNEDSAASRDLYRNSVRLIEAYTDSLRAATDSATIDRLEKELDAAMTRLNYDYSPDAAIGISEGENDTLTNLTLRYAALRDSLLYRLAHPLAPADTVPTDTVPQPIK